MRGTEKHPSGVSVRKIRAAVLRKRGGPLKIESIEMEGPRDDELLVRLVSSGVCHTDIGVVDDWDSSEEPVVLGHEGAGVVRHPQPGDPTQCRRGSAGAAFGAYEVSSITWKRKSSIIELFGMG